MKKRRHHYVWRFYLRSWATTERIWCLRDNKIFRSNLMGIGQEKDFYKLRELTHDDLVFLKKLAVDPAQNSLKILHSNLIKQFNFVFVLKRQLEARGALHPEVNSAFEEAIHNLDEELHSSIENVGLKYLKYLYNKNTNFFQTDKGAREFAYYLCIQYFRTKNLYNKIFSIKDDRFQIRDRHWKILSHIFATNVAWSIYCNRKNHQLILLINDTETNFITGDQPVINIYGHNDYTPAEKFELYYPISPKLAILLTEEKRSSKQIYLTEDDVKNYNLAINNNSHEQLYAAQSEDLADFMITNN